MMSGLLQCHERHCLGDLSHTVDCFLTVSSVILSHLTGCFGKTGDVSNKVIGWRVEEYVFVGET